LARRPERVSGMPVAREILRFADVTPSARFQENVSPGPNFIPPTVSVGIASSLESLSQQWNGARVKVARSSEFSPPSQRGVEIPQCVERLGVCTRTLRQPRKWL
jgi:hypothetical protein